MRRNTKTMYEWRKAYRDAVIPINLLLLLILVHIVYVLIRWYVKGCMRSRGY